MEENIIHKKYGEYKNIEDFLKYNFSQREHTKIKSIDKETQELYVKKIIKAYRIKELVKKGIIEEDEIPTVLEQLEYLGLEVKGQLYTDYGDFSTINKNTHNPKKELPPVLDPQEQKELFIEYKSKKDNKEIRDKLIVGNMRLAKYIGCLYKIDDLKEQYGITRDDIISYAYEGLISAIENFDPDKNVKLSTYATKYIIFYIKRQIEKDFISGITSDKYNEIQKYRKIFEERTGESLYKNPHILKDIMNFYLEEKGLTKEQAKNERKYFIFLAMELARPLDEEELSPKYISGFNYSDDPTYEEANEFLTRDKIKMIVESLPFKEKEIVEKRFGFYNKVNTLEETGKDLGLSRQRINIIERKTLNKIKKKLNKKPHINKS